MKARMKTAKFGYVKSDILKIAPGPQSARDVEMKERMKSKTWVGKFR